MKDGLMALSAALAVGDAQELLRVNAQTARYGLTLTPEQAAELQNTRVQALRAHGRVEFGSGVLDKIALVFCDSSYLTSDNYAQALGELVELFYYYKNETFDRLSDDELIDCMKKAFDGPCQGSLELLAGRELNALARDIHWGGSSSDEDDLEEDEDE